MEKGTVVLLPYGGEGMAPGQLLKFNVKIYAFWCIFF